MKYPAIIILTAAVLTGCQSTTASNGGYIGDVTSGAVKQTADMTDRYIRNEVSDAVTDTFNAIIGK